MASLNFMSYAEMDFATVPAAPPAWKKWRATSWPAPISANVPYFGSSRLIARALRFVVMSSDDSMAPEESAPVLKRAHQFCVWVYQSGDSLQYHSPFVLAY